MMSSDSDSDEEVVGCPQKKFKMLNEDRAQSFENIDLPHSSFLYENKDNQNSNDNLSSGESDSDNGYNEIKYEPDTDDDYAPISDSEFELEKYVTDDETSFKASYSEKGNDEFAEDYFNEENKTDIKPIGVDEDAHDLLDEADAHDLPVEADAHDLPVEADAHDLLDEADAHDLLDGADAHDLLDEALTNKNDDPIEKKKKDQIITPADYKEYQKTVLEEVYKNHFDILPENWIETIHKSGMPVYLHKKTRVVSLSRPYFLGPGDCKSHLAPLSAISCLQYRKGLESKVSIKKKPEDFQSGVSQGDMIIPNAKVETAQENIIKESLTHEELRDYCKSIFKFKEVKSPCQIPKVLNDEREVTNDNFTKERPSLPDSTKLISFPVQPEEHDKRCNRRREWILNPNGKSYVSILHEYLQQALKTQPWYDFKELDNAETPYSATVVLNDVQYGVGLGNSKKQAKLNAAQATLDILIPDMKNKIDSDNRNQSDPVIFDQIKVTDPRITEFCAKTTEPSPYAMLLVCLQRNFGECEISIQYKLNNRRRMLNQCTMKVGKHTAVVSCKNKRDGKQKASQIILGLLHPHIDNWGSLLRLYGNRSIKNAKEKKLEEQEITQLQSKAEVNQPNFAILNKLRQEMIKVRDQRKLKEAKEKLGIFRPMAKSCPYTIAMPSAPDFG